MKHVLFYSIILTRLGRSSAARRYILYVSLSGAVFGIMQFGEVIARKSLGASPLMVTLITMTMPVAALTSIWWAKLIEAGDQRKLLIFVGSIGYLALASGAFLFNVSHLLIFYLIFFLSFALVGPSENRILQQYVASGSTGKTVGMGYSIRMGVAALACGVAGIWMEHTEGGFRNMYPVAALIGFIAIGILATIQTKNNQVSKPLKVDSHFIFSPIKDVIALLKRRKDYLRFEIAFMTYGIAFMMTLPVVPLFLVDDLGLGYDVIGLARGTGTQIVMILTIPIFGRLFDRTTPHRMGAYVFSALGLYPVILLSAAYFEGIMRDILVYTSFAYFGTVMSGVMLLWNLSSLRFSGDEDAGVYHSVHITATGIRGVFAPLLGYFVMTFLGKTTALLTAAVLFFIGGILMVVMRKIDIKNGEATSLRAHI
ncbi:MAG: MFS transporter [Calditrichaeota bacterium]|nr:MFS transporter [Calditrichota bacterium]MBT7789806.1 MFS transporter [Calditrichota bacterium]